jgi:hypothetical protein
VDVVSAAQTRFARGGRLPGRVRLSGGRLGRRRHADARARRPARGIRHEVVEALARYDASSLAHEGDGADAGRSSGRLFGCPRRDKATGRRQERDGDAFAGGRASVEPGSAPGRHVHDSLAPQARRAEAEREAEAGSHAEGEGEAEAPRSDACERLGRCHAA